MTEPLLAVSHVFQMREATPFTKSTIRGTSVDGFGNAPQLCFLDYFVAITLSTIPHKSKGKAQNSKEPVSTEEANHTPRAQKGPSTQDEVGTV